MVIDFHVHPGRWESMTPGLVSYLEQSWPEGVEELARRHGDTAGMLRHLDECGIDRAVILAQMSPVTSGRCPNELVAELCRGSDRLIPACTFNPFLTLRPEQELRRQVQHEGFRILKLYPTYQWFYPNDPMIYPMYAVAQEVGIPVMFHTGSSVFPGSKLKYGNPLLWDEVAVDFPDLKLVLCHAGRPLWYDEAAYVARMQKNVYLDLSGLPAKNLLKYLPDLERLGGKCIFGSDWPGVRRVRENIAALRALPISEPVREAILWRTAATLLGLA